MARKFWVKKDETQLQPLWALSSDEFGPHDKWYHNKVEYNFEIKKNLVQRHFLLRSIESWNVFVCFNVAFLMFFFVMSHIGLSLVLQFYVCNVAEADMMKRI